MSDCTLQKSNNNTDNAYGFSFTFISDKRFYIHQDGENKYLNVTQVIFYIVEIKPCVVPSVPSKSAKTDIQSNLSV